MTPHVRQGASASADIRSHGCALASLAMLRGLTTDGRGLPDDQKGRDGLMLQLRDAAGMTLAQFRARGTTMTEAVTAYRAVPIRGHLDPRIVLRRGVRVRDQLLPELTPGRWAIVAVSYAVIQDAGRGVGTFRGGHACVVGDPRNGSVAFHDPLRKKGIRISIDLLVRAMETFGRRPWGNGRGEAAVAYPVPTVREALEKAQADVERLRSTLRDQRDQTRLATEERDAARTEAALLTDTVAELRTALTATEAALVECRNQPVPDCTDVQAQLDALQAASAGAAVDITTSIAALTRAAEALMAS